MIAKPCNRPAWGEGIYFFEDRRSGEIKFIAVFVHFACSVYRRPCLRNGRAYGTVVVCPASVCNECIVAKC